MPAPVIGPTSAAASPTSNTPSATSGPERGASARRHLAAYRPRDTRAVSVRADYRPRRNRDRRCCVSTPHADNPAMIPHEIADMQVHEIGACLLGGTDERGVEDMARDHAGVIIA